MISPGSGFHRALDKEILYRKSKTPGLYLPTAEEVTCAFLLAADGANTSVQRSTRRYSDSTGMSQAEWNVSQYVFRGDLSDSSYFYVGYRLRADIASQ